MNRTLAFPVSNHYNADHGGTVRAVQGRPMIGLSAQFALLAVLAWTVGLSAFGWVVGVACGVTTNVALARGVARHGADGIGPAGRVTLARATLAGGVAALIADSFWRPALVTPLLALTVVALVLDAVDGWVARRTGTVSALGARFDMEVDAFLILVLSVYVAHSTGAWVLAIGAARYTFGAAGWLLPWLRELGAAALLGQGRRGDPGHRADRRGRGRRAALCDQARTRRFAGPAGRVVRPRGVWLQRGCVGARRVVPSAAGRARQPRLVSRPAVEVSNG